MTLPPAPSVPPSPGPQGVPAPAPLVPDTMECPICREAIRRGALKCIKCSSDLRGFRKYITLGNSTLALATALLAVFGAFAPVIARAFSPHDARFHTTYVSTTHTNNGYDSLLLMVSNDGTKSGAVLDGVVGINWTLGGKDHEADLHFSKNQNWLEPTIIDAGQAVNVTMQLDQSFTVDSSATGVADVKALIQALEQTATPNTSDPLDEDLDAYGEKEFCQITLNVVYNSGVQAEIRQIPAKCSDFNNGLTTSQSGS